MTRVLVSVRSVDEALAAVDGGADFIDLKEPSDGALGGLALPLVREIIAALRSRGVGLPVSATIGDLPMHELARILDRVHAVAACGVDYVKVGIEQGAQGATVLNALAASGVAIVPVLIADRGIDAAQVAQACGAGFPGLMLDTSDKHGGSLFDRVERAELQAFVTTVQASGRLAGLAGALRVTELDAIRELAPDFAGFRSAVCDGARTGRLDAVKLRAVADALR